MKKMKNLLRNLSVLLVVAALVIPMAVPAYAADVTEPAEETVATTEEEAADPEATDTEATDAPEATATEAPAEAPAVDLNGTYHATMGIQTCNTLWIGRWGYYEVSINEQFGTDKNSVLFSGGEKTKNYVEYAGTFTDAEIAGNGTYTLSLAGADFAGEVSLSQLHIATDIPVSDEIKFTDIAVKINGKTVMNFDEGYVETDVKFLKGGMVILALNHWRAPLEKLWVDKGANVAGNGIQLLMGTGDDNIELTFTVSGFAYDKVEEALTEAPTAAPTRAAAGNDSANAGNDTGANTDGDKGTGLKPIIFVIIGVVAVAAIAAVVVISKKKKK